VNVETCAMRLMNRKTMPALGLALVAALVILLSAAGGATTAQEPTPAGRLGGGAPLDATIPVGTVPPTATPEPEPDASPGPDASPLASPIAGEPLAGVACEVAPRSLDDVAALLMLAKPLVTAPAPTSDDWSPEAEAAARAVVAELVACGNAGDQLAAYALLTDAALVDYLIGSQPYLSDIRALFFDEEPSLIPVKVTGLETRPVEPGVVYLWLDLGGGQGVTMRLAVAEERGGWRVAGITVAEPSAPST